MVKTCPKCKSKSALRKVMYGYPDGPIDEQKYVLGGCCVSENDPTLRCIECGWEGEYVNNMGSEKQFLQAVKLPDISKMTDEEIETYAKQIWQKLAKPKKGSDGGNSKG